MTEPLNRVDLDIAADMRAAIDAELDAIERRQRVRILFACESGSRAWGFPSRDSDYDVRFVYAHPRDWYLRVFEPRDVIERPVDALLDVGGWDLRKTLRLLSQSNPALQEWLSSPIVYRRRERPLAGLRALAAEALLPRAGAYHYLALARRSRRRLDGDDGASAKTLFYTLRPLLCCQWLIDRGDQPPMRFDELAAALLPAELRPVVTRLIDDKSRGGERDPLPPQPALLRWLDAQIPLLAERLPERSPKLDGARLDAAFLTLLTQVWRES